MPTKTIKYLLVVVCCWVGCSLSLLTAPVERGAAAEVVPVGNGDVNADGDYNLSDAVYLLRWLFQGGSAPAAIDVTNPQPSGRLPASGQTKCYTARGEEVDCGLAECPGQDGANQAGCSGLDRYVDNQDGTVTDACTGLVWQRSTADTNGDGSIGELDLLGWCEALTYCDSLTLAGHDDWRLPNVRELTSIIDYGRSWPAIDPVFEVAPGQYMTSTALRGGPGPGVFAVDFGIGLTGGGGGIVASVRAVRNAP